MRAVGRTIPVIVLLLASTVGAKPLTPGQQMPARCQAMMADWDAMDARLEEKVAAMNAAPAAEKTDATAAVVTELVAQRKAMRAKMRAMMAAGGRGGMMGAGCPMTP